MEFLKYLIGSILLIGLSLWSAGAIFILYENVTKGPVKYIPKRDTKYYCLIHIVACLIEQYFIGGIKLSVFNSILFAIIEIVLIYLWRGIVELPLILHTQKFQNNPRLYLSKYSTVMPPQWQYTVIMLAYTIITKVLVSILLH